jgi:predicted Rossmann-fold nucleotide-binding protein
MCKDFHIHLREHIERMKATGTISAQDDELFFFTDDPKEAVDFIRRKTEGKFGLRRKRRAILGE